VYDGEPWSVMPPRFRPGSTIPRMTLHGRRSSREADLEKIEVDDDDEEKVLTSEIGYTTSAMRNDPNDVRLLSMPRSHLDEVTA
jgi:hypothetical protein